MGSGTHFSGSVTEPAVYPHTQGEECKLWSTIVTTHGVIFLQQTRTIRTPACPRRLDRKLLVILVLLLFYMQLTSGTETVYTEDQVELQRIQDLVLQGLNITRIPLASEVNISQREYEEKYRLYLDRLNGRRNSQRMMSSLSKSTEETDDDEIDLHSIHIFRPNSSSSLVHHRSRRDAVHRDVIFVRFPLSVDDKVSSGVEEATLRMLLVRFPNQPKYRYHHHREIIEVALYVYQIHGINERILLDSTTVDLNTLDERGRWIEFNVRAAVNNWIEEEQTNLGLEVDCTDCNSQGVHIIHEQSNVSPDFYGREDEVDSVDDILRPITHKSVIMEENLPALNIITRTRSLRGKRSRMLRAYSNRLHSRRPHHTKCEDNEQKCCRHEMIVHFRDIKSLHFIIQPKSFDAGLCRGKCPVNYNVASNHAYLQGILWRQDRKKGSRPCCAPKKLEDLQVLHIDQHDNTKLKVSTYTEMRALECACS